MSYFVCESNMRDFWRHVGGIVLDGDYTRVQGLLFSIRVQLAFFTDASRAPWEGKAQVGTKLAQKYSHETLRFSLIRERECNLLNCNYSNIAQPTSRLT